ncbi:MAG: ribbon-helix-helix protein, CopG family [Candidatus Geothermincolia bacterium]
MSTLTVRLPDQLMHAVEEMSKSQNLSRAAYVRKALESMNKEALATRRAEGLAKASLRVRDESMKINAEFEAVEHAPED